MKFSYTEPNVINIFTDASTGTVDKTDDTNTITVSSGYMVINQGQCVSSEVKVFANATVQFGELYAIFLGLSDMFRDVTIKKLYGVDVNEYFVYNLFSDSLYSIKTITQYAPKWLTHNPLCNINEDNNKVPPILLKNDGKPIQNQDVICHIIALIIVMGVKIRFYHIKSHLNPENKSHIDTFYNCFYKYNPISENIKIPLVYAKSMISHNNKIDRLTRVYIDRALAYNKTEYGNEKPMPITWPIEMYPNSYEQILAYQKLFE